MAINPVEQHRNDGTTGLPKDVIQLASEAIDSASSELRRLNLEIWNNPEVRFKEEKACQLLSKWFEGQGWMVQTGVYGISTAFEARFSIAAGERSVCYNAEYDALPELGHACGHNLIATSTLASAVGASAAMKALKIPGTVIVMGTPAEETGGGKYIMANHGAWKDCSVVLMTHAMPDFSTARFATKASWKLRAKFHGKAAHAAGAPWNGNNACDAIVMAYNGLALLRQQIQKTESIQSVILEAGKAPNIIPDYAEGSFSLRASDSTALERLRTRVIPIFEGAAAATGCTVELFWDALYEDVVTNMALANRYTQYMINDLGLTPADILPPSDLSAKVDQNGSSDFGNCSYIQPGIQSLFSINATDMPHTPSFQKAAGTEFAHAESLRAGKANALIGLEVLLDEEFYGQVKSDWINDMKQRGRLPE
ncbi:hypothetical protein BDV26DRAFT_303892 [Aspergillus bertholletiae]|uniref:Peptidase M20 domain-containing protein 2 n=1 Tax=Aspergillus bertholletiae TaxID=1226010 RepID=A0A5N7BB66_9EURO|nr:hypothetical protein BDV26DRAFT_303892 [Aspergillus bertholletiae]